MLGLRVNWTWDGIHYMQRTYCSRNKTGLNDLDNHDGVINHLDPDIQECEVKWTLGSITMNKASEGDGIPAFRIFHFRIFQILKMIL